MATSDSRAEGAASVLGAHRVIRRLGADEGPYAGALVTSGASVAILVAAETISGWSGWEHAGDDHVAGPVDVVRRADGHDVLLPWCTEQISVFLGRRAAAGVGLGDGEVTTLVASVLRGLAELNRTEHREAGRWWLTDDGRPMFVIGAGADAVAGAVEILDLVREDSRDRALIRVLTPIGEGLHRGGERPVIPLHQLERWEGELLEFAAPRPLQRDDFTPERARKGDLVRRAVAETAAHPTGGRREPNRRGRARMRTRVRARSSAKGVVDATLRVIGERGRSLRDRLRPTQDRSRSRKPVRPRPRSASHGRDRPADSVKAPRLRRYIIAVAAAAVVLGAGMLWPGGGSDEPAGAKEARTPVPEARHGAGDRAGDSSDTRPTPTPSATTIDDAAEPIAAAQALLVEIDGCAETGDLVCADAVAEGSTGIVELLAAQNSGESRTLAPVDEYGDVAVIRLTTETTEDPVASELQHMVVLVRMAEKWLIRDAYDVADQPE